MNAAQQVAAADQIVSHLAEAHKHIVAATVIAGSEPTWEFTDGLITGVGALLETIIEAVSAR